MTKTTEEKIAVMQAYLEGKEVEFHFRNDGWQALNPSRDAGWNWVDNDYRIKPVIPDDIPWAYIDTKFKWYGRDADGSIWLYANKPNERENRWYPVNPTEAVNITVSAKTWLAIKNNGASWKDSLQERPK